MKGGRNKRIVKQTTAEIQNKLETLRNLAHNYVAADHNLEVVCQEKLDPIACTVFALKKRHVESIPAESFKAAVALADVVALHEELVYEYGMDTDDVRAVWYPILNKEA